MSATFLRDAIVFLLAFCTAAFVFSSGSSQHPAVSCEIRVYHDPSQKEERIVKLQGQSRIVVSCRTKEEVTKLTRELLAIFSDPHSPQLPSPQAIVRKLSTT